MPSSAIQWENSTRSFSPIPSWANDLRIKCDFVWVSICVFYLYKYTQVYAAITTTTTTNQFHSASLNTQLW